MAPRHIRRENDKAARDDRERGATATRAPRCERRERRHTRDIRAGAKVQIVTEIVRSEQFSRVARKLSAAFASEWTAVTRDALVADVAGKLPHFANYFVKHPTRSLSYIYELPSIPTAENFYTMSQHNNAVIQMFQSAGTTPRDIMTQLRKDDDIGKAVPEVLLPDDDMALELAICQTASIWHTVESTKKI